MKFRLSQAICVALPAVFGILALAQQPASPQFEAASVKPGDPSIHGQMVRTPPGRYEAHNLTLLSLLLGAYRLNPSQLIGGPAWMSSAGWDIEAEYPVSSTTAQVNQMLQSLLAERFGLVIHHETRSLPIYELTVAKGGNKLKETGAPEGSMSAGPRMIRYSSATMGDLASQLSSYLQRQVTDKTGLTGHYEIRLSFVPVEQNASPDANESGPTIFTALQEQSGL